LFRSRQFIIGIIISVIFLGWAISSADIGDVWNAIIKANYWALVPALSLYFVGVWVRAVRWRILLNPIAPKVTLNSTFEVVVIGYMANDVLPARLGELVRAFVFSKREGVRKTSTLATILVERIFDGLVLVGFAAAVVLWVTYFNAAALTTGSGHRLGTLLTEQSSVIGIVAIVFLLALGAFVIIASSQERARAAIKFGLKFVPGRLHDRVETLASSFLDGLGSLRSASGMFSVFGLSIVAWLFETAMYFVLGNWGFDLRTSDGPLPFYAYMLVVAFANLSSLIPQAPGYIGVFDWIAKVVLVGVFGAGESLALTYVLVLHAALLLPVTLLGFFYMARESLSWRDLTNLEKARAEASEKAHELEGPLTDFELVQEGKLDTESLSPTQLDGEQPDDEDGPTPSPEPVRR
jgi:glycosyltransferase 2 family protein